MCLLNFFVMYYVILYSLSLFHIYYKGIILIFFKRFVSQDPHIYYLGNRFISPISQFSKSRFHNSSFQKHPYENIRLDGVGFVPPPSWLVAAPPPISPLPVVVEIVEPRTIETLHKRQKPFESLDFYLCSL
ncbi:hypothetical protein HanRHA438_Chr04g0180021 [Helianthus annuus]|nr:hypothetical protein HanHA300_Chr04g0139551 [Helianthus annuus]KAJ0589248.1 hypothetical protein HanIR_Chr04g0183961 [Helianthus annuus]KAJ0597259.1 hypothetical protein HanHA89_Chr04g0152511 [Helianthus annuus]KAJ0757939.1 hypothetical protein HanLR1_Chr04g0144601 [Helianthus annuus]KAJ0761606.1 hypothetical protein HanOQP8_Chr04g0151841 [Helianthus annuus]